MKVTESEVHGFMPHNDGYPQLSRDWADIDCRAGSCRWNKRHKCSVPSLAEIGDDGRCKGFQPEISVPGAGRIGDVLSGD